MVAPTWGEGVPESKVTAAMKPFFFAALPLIFALPGAKPSTFSMTDALKGLPENGQLVATLDTTKGSIECVLYADKAPVTVANFVGLARGLRKWQGPARGSWVTEPAYDSTLFYRVIKGFVIQR